MYAAAAQEQQAAQEAGASGPDAAPEQPAKGAADGTVDADFTVVDEDEKDKEDTK